MPVSVLSRKNLEDWEAMFDINVKRAVVRSKAIMPQMIKNKADIYKLGSLQAKEVVPWNNLLCQ